MELYIIRHGQSANNVTMLRNPNDRGHYDPPLTELGWQQARALADYVANHTNVDVWVEQPPETREVMKGFGITRLFCSPMRRALETTLPISVALDLPAEVWKDTHEHGGLFLEASDGIIEGFPGMIRSEMQSAFPNYVLPPDITESGWWNPADKNEDNERCIARAIRVADVLRLQGGSAQRIALVTHGTFADRLIKALLNILPGHLVGFAHYNTAITRIDFRSDEKMVLRYVNRVDHLSGELMS
jgi:2,3-bisphosphoglycerate-dependent phosphoglycerate mutase